MLEHRLLPAADKNSKRLLVMMHGLGDSLAGYLWMPEVLRLPWLNYVLPNAPDDYYGGYAWFDIYGNIAPGVHRSRALVFELLDHLRQAGPPQTVLATKAFDDLEIERTSDSPAMASAGNSRTSDQNSSGDGVDARDV